MLSRRKEKRRRLSWEAKMETISQLLTDVAYSLGWTGEAIIKIGNELQSLEEIRDILTITQEQIDKLTAEIDANTTAIASAAKGIDPLRASIASATEQITTLTAKLISAGMPFDSSALDAALLTSAAQAKAIGDSLASVPPPVVPAATALS